MLGSLTPLIREAAIVFSHKSDEEFEEETSITEDVQFIILMITATVSAAMALVSALASLACWLLRGVEKRDHVRTLEQQGQRTYKTLNGGRTRC